MRYVRGSMVWISATRIAITSILLLSLVPPSTLGYNLNTSAAVLVSGHASPGSLFGHTVALLRGGSNTLSLLVGAPTSNTSSASSLEQPPGALYSCPISIQQNKISVPTCVQETLDTPENQVNLSVPNYTYKERKDGQLFGFSLSVRKDHQEVAAGAPLWSNTIDDVTKRYGPAYAVNGAAYRMSNGQGLELKQKWLPLLHHQEQTKRIKIKGVDTPRPFFHVAQAGFSSCYSKNNRLHLGAPGLLDGTGGVIHQIEKGKWKVVLPAGSEHRWSNMYFGYAVVSGNFFFPNYIGYAVAAPRYKDPNGRRRGMVAMYDTWKNVDQISIIVKLSDSTKNLWSNFGSVLCAADVDGNGKDELLVGAPMSGKMDEGRVIVYTHAKKKKVPTATLR